MDQFEAYFQRADLDRDGRISGAEAVAFFQGSNLPKQVLAQVAPLSRCTSIQLLAKLCIGDLIKFNLLKKL